MTHELITKLLAVCIHEPGGEHNLEGYQRGEWLDAAKETIARVRGGKCETCIGRGEVGGHVGQTPEIPI